MIRTYKIPHNYDLSNSLQQAIDVVKVVMDEKDRQKEIGGKLSKPTTASPLFESFSLKSTIINQLIKKYWNNKKIKEVRRTPKLQLNHNTQAGIYIKDGMLYIPPLDIKLDITNQWFWDECDLGKNSKKHKDIPVNLYPLSCEVDKDYIYLSCELPDVAQIEPLSWLGIDFNATGDLVVVSDKLSGKVKKYGKELIHKKNTYTYIRQNCQAKGKNKFGRKEYNYTIDYIRKLAKTIVQDALHTGRGIRVEGLLMRKAGQKPKPMGKKLNRIFSSFPFYMLRECIENNCEKYGVLFEKVNPGYTSQACSRCGCIGTKKHRNRVTTKKYECIDCGHEDHADSNAGFNIAVIPAGGVINAWSLLL